MPGPCCLKTANEVCLSPPRHRDPYFFHLPEAASQAEPGEVGSLGGEDSECRAVITHPARPSGHPIKAGQREKGQGRGKRAVPKRCRVAPTASLQPPCQPARSGDLIPGNTSASPAPRDRLPRSPPAAPGQRSGLLGSRCGLGQGGNLSSSTQFLKQLLKPTRRKLSCKILLNGRQKRILFVALEFLSLVSYGSIPRLTFMAQLI